MRLRPFFRSFHLLLLILPVSLLAQQPGQTAPPPPTAPTLPPSGTAGAPSTAAVAAPTHPEHPKDPYILEDGGFSIEPIYWLNKAQPKLYSGPNAVAVGDFDYDGNANNSVGGEIGIPAGPQNTLRFSYFRVQGNSNATLTQGETIFSEVYNTGDYLTAGSRIQDFKVSWDYLSYNWYRKPGTIRLKTLYELQYLTVSTNFAAPFKAVTTDSSGNTDYNTATGSENLIFPTFGLELEQTLHSHIRWEAKASGFGIPKHADLWDAEGSIGYRVSGFELLAGGRAFHFKNSPQGAQYFVDTLSGVFVGIRYYWGGFSR
jgi:hypothetical protein